MTLSGLEDNIRTLLKEREQYAPEVEKLKARIAELEKENESLKQEVEKLTKDTDKSNN